MIFEIEGSPPDFSDRTTFVQFPDNVSGYFRARAGFKWTGAMTGKTLASRLRMTFSTPPRPDDVFGNILHGKVKELIDLAVRAGDSRVTWA